MKSTRKQYPAPASYVQLLRIFFIIFFLYLMGDAFSRWDGFRFYASLSEFLPAVSLISILWSIVAVLFTLLVWFMLKVLEWICRLIKLKVRMDQLLLFLCVSVLFISAAWAGKRFISRSETSLQFKLVILVCIVIATASVTWLLRNKFVRWLEIIQERITPLVWLFAILVIISVPIVGYHTFGKQNGDKAEHKVVQSPSRDKNRPNILLVTFDALTTTDMSAYGYHRETTPFITEFAKSASLFKRLEASSNYTGPTTASLMTGKRVWTHRRQQAHGNPPLKSKTESLPLLLRNNGYNTMAFINNPVASIQELDMTNAFAYAPLPTEFTSINSLLSAIRITIDHFFLGKMKLHDWIIKEDFIFYRVVLAIQPTFDQFRKKHSTSYAPELVYNKFLTVLDNDHPKPFFAWLHVYPPHDPYLPEEPYMGMYDSSLELRTGTSQYKILHDWYRLDKNPHTFKFPEHIRPETIDVFRARYDEFIRYCDNRFQTLIAELSRRNVLKDTIIIVSADHGDIFRPPFLTHGNSLYEPETHVPLIIKEPGQTEGKVIDELIEQIDLPATILDFAKIPVPSWMEGRSIMPLLRDAELSQKTGFSMGLQFTPSRPGATISRADIAAWEGDHKLIYNLERKEALLFNLKQDPGELHNLSEKEPEMTRRLLDLINENLEKANDRISRGG